MHLENRTTYTTIWIPGRLQYPAHSLTVVVKATFVLSPDGRLVPADEQLPIEADIEAGDGGAIRYESDFAVFKPRADRLLVGTCYAPGGRPVTETTVGFSVGNWGRRLRVVGDRVWKRGLLRTGMSDPQPFTEMELSWDRAYGGPRFAPNPAGRGYHRGNPEGDRELLLPNVEDPATPVRSPSDPIAPSGFGPVARTWAPRRNMIGTYGKPWFRTRCPWVPEDIDWGVNNATPTGAQTEGYLRGDEPVVLENLDPTRARIETRLPGLRVRAIVERRRSGGRALEEVPLQLDTLWIDAKAGHFVLVWRGACAAASEEFEDIETLLLAEEPLTSPTTTADVFASRNGLTVSVVTPSEAAGAAAGATTGASPTNSATPAAAGSAAGAGSGASPENSADDADERAAAEAERKREESANRVKQLEVLRTALDRFPDPMDPIPERREARQGLIDAIELLESQERPEPVPTSSPVVTPALAWSRDRVVAILSEGPDGASDAELAGSDLSGLDLSELDFSGRDLAGTRWVGSNLTGSRFLGAVLRRSDFSGALLDRAELNEADAREVNLTGASLVATRAPAINLSRAVLDNAKGSRVHFEEAKLDGASLTGATLTESYWNGASIEKARAEGVVLTQCDITGATFAESHLSRGMFYGVRGTNAIFVKAVLDQADFSESDLDGSDFSRASMRSARLDAASLRSAVFRRSDLERASFLRANLFEAMFPAARLLDVDFRESNLYGADLTDMEARQLRVDGAILGGTRLEGARS